MKTRLLIIRLSALGDVAMTLPVIYSLAEKYKECEITVLTRPFFAKIFVNCPPNIRLLTFDAKGRHKGLCGFLNLILQLRKERFDHVADLHNVLRSWIIDVCLWLCGSKVKMVKKCRSGRKRMLREKVQQRSFIDRYKDVFTALGFPVEDTFTGLFPTGENFDALNVKHPAVGIAPFARYDNKTYTHQQMVEVINGLCSHGVNVYLFGSKGAEQELLCKWASGNPRCEVVAGRFTIADELRLMHNIDVMLAMDSANQHLAAIAGTQVVTIWGSTTPKCGFAAYHQPPENSIIAELDCQPCTVAGSKTCCCDLECMRKIKPSTVISKIYGLVEISFYRKDSCL